MSEDFARLYAHLGVREDCSLDEFKRACRRRIREQHPDRRQTGAGRSAESRIALAELLPLYARAVRFHRLHGRLPGAPLAAHAPPPARMVPAPTARERGVAPPTTPPPRRSLRGPLLLSVAVVALLAAIGSWRDDMDPQAAATTPAAATVADPEPATSASEQLELGMAADTVRAIQGEPLQWNGSEWIYGPSWLRFEDGYLVDWYSSPLHPLHTRTRTPPRQ